MILFACTGHWITEKERLLNYRIITFLFIAGKITKSQLLQYLISHQFKKQQSYQIYEQEMFLEFSSQRKQI
jgi:hypothetical protein